MLINESIPKQTEEWREIPDFPGYFASTAGQVAHRTTTAADFRKIQPLVLTPSRNPDGYETVSIQGERIYVHRVVSAAFLYRPEGADEVDHRNKIRWDNRPENLEWVTRGENVRRAKRWPRGTASDVQLELFLFQKS